ncbi:acid protease [Dentipellis sp. KUC8613]|nr:acid protease [Dentipellis sp. KUC8613]
MGIIDTGTSALYMHPLDALAIHSAISGVVELTDDSYAIPCVTQSKLSITINGFPFDVDPRDIVANPIGSGICYSSIVSDPERRPGEMVIGTAFLKNVYFTLDVTRDRIGFAKLR